MLALTGQRGVDSVKWAVESLILLIAGGKGIHTVLSTGWTVEVTSSTKGK
jgi:hypothetical protein